MFLRFRRRMLAYIAFSALFLITFIFLAGEDLQVKKHAKYVADKAKQQWDFDPKNGGVKPEDAAMKNRPNGEIPEQPVPQAPGIYTTTNALGSNVITTSAVREVVGEVTRQPAAPETIQTQAPIVPVAGPVDLSFEPAHKNKTGEKPIRQGTDAWFQPEHWVKQPEHYPVPADQLIKLPTGTPEQMPTIQASFPPETEMQKQTRKNRQAIVKEEFKHAWRGYKKNAWTHDEVKPVSGGVKDPFCGWAATMVDALDTMWIMGLKQDFEEAVEEIGKLDFTTTTREQIPMFETTIRYLGGLLAAYDVSGADYPILLAKAKELAEILMGAFDTPNRMPVLYYSWKPVFAMQAKRAGSRANFAELSSLTMEFTRLAQLTGEDKYYDAVARITNELVEWQKRGTKIKGVFPDYVDAQGCNKSAGVAAINTTGGAHFFEEADSNVYNVANIGGGPANVVKRAGLSEHATPVIHDPSKDWDCVPQGLTGEPEGREQFSMGGGQDSGYEYFLKMHLLLGGLEPKYKQLYRGTVEAVKNHMLYRPMISDESRNILFSNKVSTFGHPERPGDLQVTYEITHLTCFIGGMFGMGAKIFNDAGELSIAERLTDGCVYAYEATKSGIMPELARGVPCDDVQDCPWDESRWFLYLDPLSPEDRQRDVDIWDRKFTERAVKEAGALQEKQKEEAEKKKVQDASLAKDRAKLDASFAAYAYRTKPGTAQKMSAEDMLKVDEAVKKFATVEEGSMTEETLYMDGTVAKKLPKDGAKDAEAPKINPDVVSENAPKNASDADSTSSTESAAAPTPVESSAPGDGVVANPDSHAAAPSDAVAIESPAAKAGGHGSKKAKRLDAIRVPPIEESNPKDFVLPSGDSANSTTTSKDGAEATDDAAPAVEGGALVGGAPPQSMPILNPDDRIDVDGPRPQTHKEYVTERIAKERMPRGFAGMDSTAYILRPEAIESVWYMHRITADPQWADKGWNMFTAIIRNTKTEHGHSALHDVNVLSPQKVDSMESFWLAETLKYFYLLYSEPSLISLDDWVLNTEAHPFRRPTLSAFGESTERIRKWQEFTKGRESIAAEAMRVQKQHEEYLKRLKEIETAKAAGAGRGGVAAKVVNLPDTPINAEAAELKKAQDEYLRQLGELEFAAKAKQPVAPVAQAAPAVPAPVAAAPPPVMDLEALMQKQKDDAYAAKLAKLEKLENDMAAGTISSEEAARIAKELKTGLVVGAAPGAKGKGTAKGKGKAKAPAAAVVVPAAPAIVPDTPAPDAADSAPIAPPIPPTLDLEAYVQKQKDDAAAARLAKLEKLEKDMAEGTISSEEAAKIAKELKDSM